MLTVRPYRPYDLSEILHLFYSTIHTVNIKDYSAEQVDIWAPEKPATDKWKERFASTYTIVAVKENIIVGFSNLSDDGIVDTLYVHKSYQGQGIASALMKNLEEQARKTKIQRLKTAASITARSFFEKNGFKEIEPCDKVINGQHFRVFRMEKELV